MVGGEDVWRSFLSRREEESISRVRGRFLSGEDGLRVTLKSPGRFVRLEWC